MQHLENAKVYVTGFVGNFTGQSIWRRQIFMASLAAIFQKTKQNKTKQKKQTVISQFQYTIVSNFSIPV